MPAPPPVDLASPSAVTRVLQLGTRANLDARCRQGSIDRITGPGTLIATGDLHDNPAHYHHILDRAGYTDDHPGPPHHLTLHELIHGENLHDGMDPSYRVLVRAASLKAAFPETVHVLLANHEISQIAGRGVIKNGVNCVKAFNAAVDYVFADEAPAVFDALAAFIRSMPLALRADPPSGGMSTLCAHSLPADSELAHFDTSILNRPLTESDYQPRTGSAHLMTWGRGQSLETMVALGRAWDVGFFILGHEKADTGATPLPPCGLILNSDHARPALCALNLLLPQTFETGLAGVERWD